MSEADSPAHRTERPTRVAVKVCGVTSVEDALHAARCGADAIGLVFWPKSPRRVGLETARRIAGVLPPFVTRVGVFVDAEPGELREIGRSVGLDVLQLHGDEPVSILDAVERRVLKAFRVGERFEAGSVRAWVERGAGVLLDTAIPGGMPGGTGRTFDWTEAVRVRSLTPHLVLAGGLDGDNVEAAVSTVRPDAVDVSSGVEASPGRKDPDAVRGFLARVHALAYTRVPVEGHRP